MDRGSTLNVTCVVSTRSKAPDYIIWSHYDRVNIFCPEMLCTVEFLIPYDEFAINPISFLIYCRPYCMKVRLLIKHFRQHIHLTLVIPMTQCLLRFPRIPAEGLYPILPSVISTRIMQESISANQRHRNLQKLPSTFLMEQINSPYQTMVRE